MISFIKGELDSIYEDGIVIENGGIGYDIKVPLSVMNELPSTGEEVKIYTYLYVREDILCLYGFLSRDDLQVFKLLITVNGIGPKGALGILSTISPDDLRFAVLADDAKAIAKAPGIGAKTASKLILELKDKLKLEDAFEQKLSKVSMDSPSAVSETNAKNEAIQALVALGYTNTEALKAVRGIDITPDMETEDILRLSLKKISLL
ncbi:Holliday junction DNA helicase subunit RuvA [Anaerosporobacter mobilis DSM 15930]|jgi:Holliday junction DNA helicase RuvA|uniref:Holliday junction branch migration complex subunit RuvA n=1 Tax=Anaerosporobacter mobilis DSM 15930 TaxID=1120996 RepID=A0A1M7ESH3_9FIRM|nr:Holliday junction branch migration protein RuvA [Anaerosporobacter mobilis]SHL94607.1 Holliday junction DNA helicase subunit RuvA [Anaerosporobacter mobilis DSM 15930]